MLFWIYYYILNSKKVEKYVYITYLVMTNFFVIFFKECISGLSRAVTFRGGVILFFAAAVQQRAIVLDSNGLFFCEATHYYTLLCVCYCVSKHNS